MSTQTPASPQTSHAPSVPARTRPGKMPIGKRRPRRRRWPYALIALLILTGLGFWAWRHHTAAVATAAAHPPELVSVSRGSVEKSVESSGKVVSNLEVDIKCRASGEVIKLPFDISQSVKKGDLLCQLDPTDEKLAVRSAEALVAQATAKLLQAREDLQQSQENLATTRRRDEATLAAAKVKATNLQSKAQRQKQLLDQNFGSREDLEAAQTDAADADMARADAEISIDELDQQAIQVESKRQAVDIAQAQLESDKVALDTQSQQLLYTTVTAPIDGVVSALNVQMGTIVASGMSGFSGGTTIMTLSDLSRVFVMATVDESDIGGVRVGQQARLMVASFPGRTFKGQVQRIAAKGVNSSNVVTFEVKVEVIGEDKGLLRPEMTGNVTVLEMQKSDVLTVPSSALIRQGDQVFVTMAEGQRRPVKLGLEGAETVEILSGVSEGERVQITTEEMPTRWKSSSSGPPPR